MENKLHPPSPSRRVCLQTFPMDLLGIWSPASAPIRSLLILYIIRTILLVGCAVSSSFLYPGSSPFGYDTSTSHLISQGNDGGSIGKNPLSLVGQRLSMALARWDALYYVNTGRRGSYLWEQEWAFPPGLGFLVRAFEWTFVKLSGGTKDALLDLPSWALASAAISCAAHALSSLVLYQIVRTIFQTESGDHRDESKYSNAAKRVDSLAFMTAVLHILSPAGIFLSAPYSESLFSLLSFLGYWLYCRALAKSTNESTYALLMISAGLNFGVSCAVRSNGIFNGTLFLIEMAVNLWSLLNRKSLMRSLSRCLSVGIAGLLTGSGMLWLQYEGWKTYCSGGGTREWCFKMVPSIYTFVQEHYWNVGLFRYWTLSNLPLFLLAFPVITTLVYTSFLVLRAENLTHITLGFSGMTTAQPGSSAANKTTHLNLLKRLAAPQLLLGALAITNYHIQIITRLSSGVALWYIVIAGQLISEASDFPQGTTGRKSAAEAPAKKQPNWGGAVVRWSVGYAIVQSLLFGGFLPPA